MTVNPAQSRQTTAVDLLVEAGAALANSLDLRTTMREVAKLTVPHLADLCVIDLLDDDGKINDVAVSAADEEIARKLEQLRARFPLDPAGAHPVARVIRSGQSELLAEMADASLRSFAQSSVHARFMIAHHYRSAVVAPLLARGRTLGAISILRLAPAEAGERTEAYGQDDLELACELARRAALAIDNARLFSDLRRLEERMEGIAHTLQRALLPESLPQIDGVEIETLYAAAGELNEVGGDFYDVFDYGDGRTMLAIGDVCGKGPRAAGVTALARHTLRAAAIGGQSPTGMLATLHQALLRQPPGADLCTVCLIMLVRECSGARLTIALAGHPPPLLIRRSGAVEQVGRSGTVLGVIDPVSIDESEIALSDGETLLLYTDGVIEAGRPGHLLGEQGLLELCTQASGVALAAFLKQIETAALSRTEGQLRDDIALLALRLTPLQREDSG